MRDILRTIHVSLITNHEEVNDDSRTVCGERIGRLPYCHTFLGIHEISYYKPTGLFRYCEDCYSSKEYKQALIMYELTH